METIGEPLAFYPKLLKLKQSIPSVPKSLGQQGLRKIRSLEQPSTIFPTTPVNSIAIKTSPCLANFNAAIRPENRCD
jgi:hypothetical protein